jgi:hypothetical protein
MIIECRFFLISSPTWGYVANDRLAGPVAPAARAQRSSRRVAAREVASRPAVLRAVVLTEPGTPINNGRSAAGAAGDDLGSHGIDRTSVRGSGQ